MELVYATFDGGAWEDQGAILHFGMDLAYGDDENDFEITVPAGTIIPKNALVYIDGTEWGGVVRGQRVSTFDGPVSVVTGQTWHGILSETYIMPPDGETHCSVSGELNSALAEVARHAGLGYMFETRREDSGVQVSFTFDRFCDVYSGLRKMLSQHGMKLKIEKPPRTRPVICAEPISEHIDEGGSIGYEMTEAAPYNHILCIGKGEMEERVVVSLYADEKGNIGTTPTFSGVERRTYRYELTTADAAEMAEEGAEKLRELWLGACSCDLRLPDGESYDVDDIVGVVDEINGITVVAAVSKVIVKVSDAGEVSVSNEVGAITARKN